MNNEETKIVAKIAERFERLCTNKNEECISNYQDVFSCALEVAEWKQQQMIEKTIDWLDSIMYYVSKEDKRLVCNFTSFDELIDDYKQAMKEE